eukprot:TRINITY_DN14200_c0_g1_i1.p1 TRINITY_DN14200_c0_g1~~TRINITY_DN14200_c0_g1_i1.p1  ORF type:complete len:347 (-),score=111.55 TRINITY_DN14200_c0_g1_i1:99-1139(-)
MKGGTLNVTAVEGKGLAAKDSNGKSDPYVKILMLGCKSKKGAEQKTKPIDKTLEPKWNHKFNPIPYDNEDTSAVHVILYDKDLVGSDDFMGQIMIPIYEIKAAGGKLDKWFQLVTNEVGDNVSGSILLHFEMTSDEEQEQKKKEEIKRLEEEKNRKQEEETRKKMEEQEKQLKMLNEKKKELEEQRNMKLSQNTQQHLNQTLPPPLSTTPKIGNAVCMIQFVGQSSSELSMNVGDDITIDDSSDPTWWYAKNHTSGLEAYVPAQGGYVALNQNNTSLIPRISQSSKKIGNSTCLIQFVGQSDSELTMNVGDDISVDDDRNDPNWWYAKNHTTGKEGYIPAQGGYIA